MVISYNIWVQILMKSLFAMVLMFCFYCIIKYPLKDEYLLTFPLIAICVYGWLYIGSFKIEINDGFVMQYGITKKIIRFEEVAKIEIYTDHLIIKSQNTKIKITSDLEKQTEATSFILCKLKERKEHLEVKGDKEMINSFLEVSI